MAAPRLVSNYLREKRAFILAANAALVLAIALVDWRMHSNISLGFLYLFPMLVGGYYLARLQIFTLAVACALLRETFAPWAWQAEAIVRATMATCAYFGAGLFVAELSRLRQEAIQQSLLRQAAEEQLRALIESNPAAIFTLDGDGNVLLANEAAHRLLGFAPGSLSGEPVARFLPVLTVVPQAREGMPHFRSTVECTGRKRNGEVFLAHAWFSTYHTVAGPRLAAIVWDGSEELRDREGLGLHSVMTTSQILLRAALHEVRNLCAAAAVAHANLGRLPGVGDSEDFQALGTLVRGLEKIASSELRPAAAENIVAVDLRTVLDELRIVIEPSFQEAGIAIQWSIPDDPPAVRADHHGLLQVFLNLAQNSRRALLEAEKKELTITAALDKDRLLVHFQDTGCGIPVPDRLFQPLQSGAEATGLGLYISRAIVRSFAGDLRYEPQPLGSCFTVQLLPASGRIARDVRATVAAPS